VPRRVVRRLGRTLGRRGAILLCYGTVWALYGYAQITTPQPDQRGLQPILERVPLTVWGCLWVATGLIAIVSAWLPQGRDWAGFLALPALVLPWMTSYLLAWLMGYFPRGWVAALVWAVIAVPVLVVAVWSEPPALKRVSRA
jgi:fatty acid desaturase